MSHTLRLERTFDAPRERVFDAWTDPKVLRRWWAASPDWDTAEAEVDLRVGGRYRLAMRDPSSGITPTVEGEYREIDRPSRLSYTWTWVGAGAETQAGSENTLVTVEFAEDGGRTTVRLTHDGFASDANLPPHEHGWNACMDNLERRVLSPAPDRTSA